MALEELFDIRVPHDQPAIQKAVRVVARHFLGDCPRDQIRPMVVERGDSVERPGLQVFRQRVRRPPGDTDPWILPPDRK